MIAEQNAGSETVKGRRANQGVPANQRRLIAGKSWLAVKKYQLFFYSSDAEKVILKRLCGFLDN